MAARSASIFSRDIVVSAIRDAFPKLDPRQQIRNPVMFIVEIGSVITTGIFLLDLVRGDTDGLWFVARDRRLALADGAVRQLRRGDCREPWQGPGGDAASGAHDDARQPPHAVGRARAGAGSRPAARRRGGRRRRRVDPRRRRRDRGRGIRGRVRHHRRVRAGDPRGGRRPLGRHRRHPAALRPAGRRGHAGARPVVPRPHDLPGRGRRAAQDAERGRPQHPAGGTDVHRSSRRWSRWRPSPATPARRSRRPC